jgi:hypothetical protein
VLVWAMVLPRGTWGAIWDSLDWNNPDSPLKCCDAINVYETDDNSTYHGLPFSRFYANASNTATCAAGFQCIPCLPGIRTVCTCPRTLTTSSAFGGCHHPPPAGLLRRARAVQGHQRCPRCKEGV